MPAGLEIYNDAGIPQTIDFSYNLVLLGSGTVTIGSNATATGTTNSVTLTTRAEPYIVFIKTSGNACITASRVNGFSWFMAQGTTTFQWWAYARGAAVSSAGMQVYNSDGTLRWDLGTRPLVITSLQAPAGAIPYGGEMSAGNVLAGATYAIPSGHAVCYSDPGQFLDLYTGFSGATLQPNMRYWPCISVSGTVLTMNWGRRYANRPPLPAGIVYQTFATKNPSFIITAAAL